MMKELKCEYFHWGPLICRFKVPLISIDILLKHSPKKETHASTLAGIIKDQFKYPEHFFVEQLSRYFEAYTTMLGRYFKRVNLDKNKFKLLVPPWINYMVAGEFNPPHIHSPAHFSCVLFLQVPEELKKENKEYKGTSGAGPGGIAFRYGENGHLNIINQEFFPEAGDFFIFPADLVHWVFPFKSKGERISISANFMFEAIEGETKGILKNPEDS